MIKTLINVIKSFISGRSWVVDIIVFILQLWPFFLMCVMGASSDISEQTCSLRIFGNGVVFTDPVIIKEIKWEIRAAEYRL